MWTGGEHKTFVGGYSGPHVSKELPTKQHTINGSAAMGRALSCKHEAISQASRLNVMVLHEIDPHTSDKGNHGHREGTSLRDGAQFLTRIPYGIANLVPN